MLCLAGRQPLRLHVMFGVRVFHDNNEIKICGHISPSAADTLLASILWLSLFVVHTEERGWACVHSMVVYVYVWESTNACVCCSCLYAISFCKADLPFQRPPIIRNVDGWYPVFHRPFKYHFNMEKYTSHIRVKSLWTTAIASTWII